MAKKRKRKRKKSSKAQDYTPLEKHRRKGKILSPPLATLPKLKPSSWIDDWLPEMLWVALLLFGVRRDDALALIRATANAVFELDADAKPADATLSALALVGHESREGILAEISSSVQARESLRPLLLLNGLPGLDDWKSAIGQEPEPEDWGVLASAVASALFHQSEAATDCRWARLIFMSAAGKLKLSDEEQVKELLNYPNYGDMRKVRPFIRATEIAVRNLDAVDDQGEVTWPKDFWDQCFVETECYPLALEGDEDVPVAGTTIDKLDEVYGQLVSHAFETASTTGIDPMHDTIFGIALYVLSILKEMLRIGGSHQITSRLGLRTVLEAYVTLAYLIEKNDPELWRTHRIYGAGQAKLSFLKVDETADPPLYVDTDTLRELANEDIWQEFLSIDLGHWEKSNLRQLSVDSDTKEAYDLYYPWPSTFAHAHWGALRDSVFNHCGNPLHRLHRIPRDSARALPDVVPDACQLADRILELLAASYPPFPHRVSLDIKDDQPSVIEPK